MPGIGLLIKPTAITVYIIPCPNPRRVIIQIKSDNKNEI